MIPIPTSRVFRSRRGALMWSFWVIVAAILGAGFADAPTTGASATTTATRPTDALGMAVDDKDLKELMKVINAS